MGVLKLKTGREKSVLKRHPWIFSGAVESISDSIKMGEIVEVHSSRNEFLAWAAYNPQSQIAARIWSWNRDITVNKLWITHQIRRALAMRSGLPNLSNTNAYRIINGESDGLPGLVIDRYRDVLIVQFLSAGAEYWRESIITALVELINPQMIYERSDNDSRLLEGLPIKKGIIWGKIEQMHIMIEEYKIKYLVAIDTGQKTGFYLDQRANRMMLRQFTQNKNVLDCFSYTGGFMINALAGGARSVTCIDSSAEALEMARQNMELNHGVDHEVDFVQGDVFQILRRYRDQARTFDVIILDPPKFAQKSSQVQKASRAYKDINLLALKLLTKGGHLFTFSCSGGISEDLFQKILFGASLDAGVNAQIIAKLHQDSDHPVALNFPEGAYLKGLVLQVGN